MEATISGSATAARVSPKAVPTPTPSRERVTTAMAKELQFLGVDVNEGGAHARLYRFPTIKDFALAEMRARRVAGDDEGIQKFLHDLSAASRSAAPPLTIGLILQVGTFDRKDDGTREALIAMRTRETFVAWMNDFYRFAGVAYGLIEAGKVEYQL